MNIKPIETVYNGYRFRSRLEARWAVFFDAAGIKYEYEQEGYVLSDGTKYLPDFYLPELDVHCEVKGDRPDAWDEIRKAKQSIEWGGPIKRIIILSNIPRITDNKTGIYHYPCYFWNGAGDYVELGWWFFFEKYPNHCEGKISGSEYGLPWYETWEGNHIRHGKPATFQAVSDMQLKDEIGVCTDTPLIYKDMEDQYWEMVYNCNKSIFDALKAARKARFEHGETPLVKGVTA